MVGVEPVKRCRDNPSTLCACRPEAADERCVGQVQETREALRDSLLPQQSSELEEWRVRACNGCKVATRLATPPSAAA